MLNALLINIFPDQIFRRYAITVSDRGPSLMYFIFISTFAVYRAAALGAVAVSTWRPIPSDITSL